MCTRLEVCPTVGLSRQRHLLRVLSTHTHGPNQPFIDPFKRPPPPQHTMVLVRTRGIGPPYPHACHRWQLKLTPACAIILSSGFDGLGFVLNPISMAAQTVKADPAVTVPGRTQMKCQFVGRGSPIVSQTWSLVRLITNIQFCCMCRHINIVEQPLNSTVVHWRSKYQKMILGLGS